MAASHSSAGAPMRVLISSTFAFTICFAVWMIFAVLGIPIKTQLGLSETQFGLLAAMPVLTGSLVRVPLGIWTDRYGGRPVFFILMLLAVVPIWLMSYATEYWQFLVLALFVGLTGGSFSVGTPYVARWFPRNKQGLAMGVFGAGNSGSAITKFVAPALIAAAGGSWVIVPKVYAVALLVTAILFWVFSASDPSHRVKSGASLSAQFAMLKDPRVWRYCQYYSVVFGGYVALALWMTKYYIGEYGFDMKLAALLAACFSLPGGVLRAVGGWISDRYGAYKTTWWVMWVCWVAFFILSYPQTHFTVLTAGGPRSFDIALGPVSFTVLLFIVGIAMAIGKASVFKFISDEFGENIGAVSGIVGLAGGLGGFVLPIMFGVLLDLTGIRSSAFMLLYGTVCVSLIFMHFSFRPESAAIARQQAA
ncbi:MULTISPECIES: MFS transporter [Achromobacter]|jgi:NNP family nitrate/nitrite transporter-like MFS transporter|uniref:Nitrate/nitrite transporter n=2 Tax=Achromobacter denitrificans TaxID=32002 RepID=A0ABZ3G7E3_ACHDE|nr:MULTISPECIES: nitrate/nitrite transporter [Achromobacter]MDF3849068.1 NarK/NasA family nitrate transporter [Achromobacter denitrificans]MDF3857966.1 NarK/NasA family nitrate transporter [Achromobacter denitrificans]MDF3939171.1 NarK/NasA family nitrate transporter [Achromobacter denitrificans]MDX3879274.1 nitrate/nitrite transporter [Achromobacter sp.]OLU06434.1 MFS transporter [Achromobacter denitrificans]